MDDAGQPIPGTGIFDTRHGSVQAENLYGMLRAPLDGDALVEALAVHHPEARDPGHDGYEDFWLVVALTFHRYAIPNEWALARALEIVRTGADLARKRRLGESEAFLAARAAILEATARRLVAPHPRPRDRRILGVPQPIAFERGACVRWPTRDAEPRDPLLPPGFDAGWAPDGWGALLVLDAWLAHGVLAQLRVAVLEVDPGRRPAMGDIRLAPVHLDAYGERGEPVPRVLVGTLDVGHAAFMGMESVGRLDLDGDAVQARCPLPRDPPPYRNEPIRALLRNGVLFDALPGPAPADRLRVEMLLRPG
jgi:hypothetical protein